MCGRTIDAGLEGVSGGVGLGLGLALGFNGVKKGNRKIIQKSTVKFLFQRIIEVRDKEIKYNGTEWNATK